MLVRERSSEGDLFKSLIDPLLQRTVPPSAPVPAPGAQVPRFPAWYMPACRAASVSVVRCASKSVTAENADDRRGIFRVFRSGLISYIICAL